MSPSHFLHMLYPLVTELLDIKLKHVRLSPSLQMQTETLAFFVRKYKFKVEVGWEGITPACWLLWKWLFSHRQLSLCWTEADGRTGELAHAAHGCLPSHVANIGVMPSHYCIQHIGVMPSNGSSIYGMLSQISKIGVVTLLQQMIPIFILNLYMCRTLALCLQID